MTKETDPADAARLLDSLRAEQATLLREGRSLAELIGMSQAHLDQILSGEKPVGAPSLRKIAAYFARSQEGNAEVEPQPAVPTALSGMGGSTIRLVELGAVAQRQYIAARLEGSGIPKGIASYVALHVELDGLRSTAEGVRAAEAMAKAMLDEEAAEEAVSASGD